MISSLIRSRSLNILVRTFSPSNSRYPPGGIMLLGTIAPPQRRSRTASLAPRLATGVLLLAIAAWMAALEAKCQLSRKEKWSETDEAQNFHSTSVGKGAFTA